MQVYSITSVVNSDELTVNNASYGATTGTWYEVFSNKEDAIKLLREWGCEPLADNIFVMQKEENGKVYNFYYKINSQYFVGAAS